MDLVINFAVSHKLLSYILNTNDVLQKFNAIKHVPIWNFLPYISVFRFKMPDMQTTNKH